MSACPVKNLLEFIPVRHLLKLHLLQRSTGHNKSVKLLVSHALKSLIEHLHVLHRGVLGSMAAQLHQLELNLQRRVGEQTYQVRLSSNLDGHQVEHHNSQRTDVLTGGAAGIHDKDILPFQDLYRRQFIG